MPILSVVLLSAIVGLSEVLQQMPLAVIADPPSDVMLPPPEAEIPRLSAISAVVMVAGLGFGVSCFLQLAITVVQINSIKSDFIVNA